MLATLALLGSTGSLVHMAIAYLSKRRLFLIFGVVMLLQLTVVPPYFLLDATFYARLPSCNTGLFLSGEGWWLSLLWTVLIVVPPLPVAIFTARQWRQEYALYNGFTLRQIDKREDKLAILRMQALLVCTAVMNVGLGIVWAMEIFELTGAGTDGNIWSSLVAIPLRSLLILVLYIGLIIMSEMAMNQ